MAAIVPKRRFFLCCFFLWFISSVLVTLLTTERSSHRIYFAQMKILLSSLIYFQVFGHVFAKIILQLPQELLSQHNFHSAVYNVIVCDDHDSISWTKMLSVKFRKFVAVHSADKAVNYVTGGPQTFVLELRCPKAAAVLEQAENLKLFGKPFQWLLLSDDVPSNATCEISSGNISSGCRESWFWPFLETLSILTDSDVKVVEKRADQKITVAGVYKLQSSLIKEPLVEWDEQKGLTVLNSKSLAIRRWNLQNLTLPSTIVVTHLETLKHLEDLADKHIDTTTKVTYNMVRLFGDLFNATINYKVQREWGVLINGSWTAMVGDLEKKEIEFAAAPLFFQKGRMHFIEYYATVTPSRGKFLFLSPPLSYSSNIFKMPFDAVVWYCCFSMVAVSCFLLFTALNYEKSHLKVEEGTTEKSVPRISFSEILVLNIGAICLQGTVAPTKDPPGRIITLFLYLSYMFLYISYSASIVAILQSSDTSIQTLSDFLKSPLKAGADDAIYNQYYFKTADDEIRKAIYRTKIAPKGETPHFLPPEEGIKEVRKGFYGYHVEVSVGYQLIQKFFTEEEKCALQELRESFLQFNEPWLVMKKKTPYAELFRIGMYMCIERGFKNRFVRRLYTKKPVCSSKSVRFVSVGIFDCYYAFMLLTSGCVVAFGIMLLEISFSRYSKMRKKRKLLSKNDYLLDLEFFN